MYSYVFICLLTCLIWKKHQDIYCCFKNENIFTLRNVTHRHNNIWVQKVIKMPRLVTGTESLEMITGIFYNNVLYSLRNWNFANLCSCGIKELKKHLKVMKPNSWMVLSEIKTCIDYKTWIFRAWAHQSQVTVKMQKYVEKH